MSTVAQTASRKRPTVKDRFIAVKGLPTDDRERLIQAVRPYLNDRSPSVRWAAVDVIREEALGELDSAIRRLLIDKNGGVRALAIECIGDFHEGETIKVRWLYPFLHDSHTLVRVATLESLAHIRDKNALPNMIECLRDIDPLVRSYAAISIAELGGKKFRKAIEIASKAEVAETAKPWFARALLLLNDVKQFPILLELLSSPSPTARCAAANALTEFEWSKGQLETVLTAVANASRNSLARSDQSTMERVLKQLLEEVSSTGH